MLRIASLVAVLCVTGASYASFELALVLQDYTPANGGQDTLVTRWDPVTRVSLGRFSIPGATSQSMLALNEAAPGTVDLITRTSNLLTVRRFNYGNGEAVSTINTGISSTALTSARYLSNGNLLVTGTFSGLNVARIYTTGGALIRTFTNPAGATSVLDAVQDAAGNTFLLTSQPGSVSANRYVLTSYAVNSSVVANTVTATDNTSTLHNSLTFAGANLVVNRQVLSSRMVYTPSGTTIGLASFTGGWVVPTESISAGHDDIIHGFGYDSAQSRMYFSTARASTSAGNSYEYITSSAYGQVYDSAIVVAPEPGTLLALGAGVGVLLRRRRKSCPN